MNFPFHVAQVFFELFVILIAAHALLTAAKTRLAVVGLLAVCTSLLMSSTNTTFFQVDL